MSQPSEIIVDCPGCRRKSAFAARESLNIGEEPQGKQAVLDGSLFTYCCPACGTRQDLEYPFLYHDPDRHFMVWWLPEKPGAPVYTAEELQRSARFIVGYHLRIVTSYNRLREKILILENRLSDRAVEVLKHSIWSASLSERGVALNQVFFAGANEEDDNLAVEFAVLYPNGNMRTLRVSGSSGYARALEKVKALKIPVQASTGWVKIDHTFAEQIKADPAQ